MTLTEKTYTERFDLGAIYKGWMVINITEDTPRFDRNDYDLIIYETEYEDVYFIEKNETTLTDKDIAYICNKNHLHFRRDTDLWGEDTITVHGY